MLQRSEYTLWTLDIHGNTGAVTSGYGNYYGNYGYYGGGYYSSPGYYGYGNSYGGSYGEDSGYYGYYGYYGSSGNYDYWISGYGNSFNPMYNPVISFNMTLPGIDPSQYPGETKWADGWQLGKAIYLVERK